MMRSWNGYKIVNPTVLARLDPDELKSLLVGYGHKPLFVEGTEPKAAALDTVLDRIASIQKTARAGERSERPRWPMIVLRTPKGWTGPKEVDGLKTEGSGRSHQVPLAETRRKPAHRKLLDEWVRS